MKQLANLFQDAQSTSLNVHTLSIVSYLFQIHLSHTDPHSFLKGLIPCLVLFYLLGIRFTLLRLGVVFVFSYRISSSKHQGRLFQIPHFLLSTYSIKAALTLHNFMLCIKPVVNPSAPSQIHFHRFLGGEVVFI